MTKKIADAQYFADDKDVFDLVASARRKLSESKIIEFLKERGILYSIAESREELALRMSRMTWGWSDICRLVELTDTAARRERTTYRSIDVKCSRDDIAAALDSVIQSRSSTREERYEQAPSGNDFDVHVIYTDVDWSRTRLQQRTRKELRLEAEPTNDGRVLIRYNASDRGHEICADLISAINERHPCTPNEISLQLIRDAARRTEFFLTLMRSIDSHEMVDVSDLDVNNLDLDDDAEHDDESPYEAEDEPSDPSAAFSTQKKAMLRAVQGTRDNDTSDLPGVIKNAALSGTSVHRSALYSNLTDSGFYITSAVWRVREKRGDRTEIELEAEFSDPKHCTGFRYAVRGIYPRRLRGGEEGSIRATARAPTPDERERYLRLIELSAEDALARVTSSPQDDEP